MYGPLLHVFTTCLPVFSDLFKVYWADHTYTTLRVSMDASVEEVVRQASDKLGISAGEELVLCEVKSSGGKVNERSMQGQ